MREPNCDGDLETAAANAQGRACRKVIAVAMTPVDATTFPPRHELDLGGVSREQHEVFSDMLPLWCEHELTSRSSPR